MLLSRKSSFIVEVFILVLSKLISLIKGLLLLLVFVSRQTGKSFLCNFCR